LTIESNFPHYLTVNNSAERKPEGRVAWDKSKELSDREIFQSNNPEVNLPGNLELQILVEDFTPLVEGCDECLKEGVSVGNMT